TAFLTESRIDRSDALQRRLIPATWMIALNGKRPAEVSTAPPSGIAPCLRSSRNGPVPPRRLMAPETPWGRSSHQGMIFRFQALTITSTAWSSKSPSTTVTFTRDHSGHDGMWATTVLSRGRQYSGRSPHRGGFEPLQLHLEPPDLLEE